MRNATDEFFEQLGRRGWAQELEELDGTIRFDLTDDAQGIDRWFVVVKRGNVRVSRDAQPEDAVVHADRAVFDQMVTGRLNRMPALLRNLFWVEGDAELFRVFSNILRDPARGHDPRDFVAHRR